MQREGAQTARGTQRPLPCAREHFKKATWSRKNSRGALIGLGEQSVGFRRGEESRCGAERASLGGSHQALSGAPKLSKTFAYILIIYPVIVSL